jgi:NAD(P)-dependent dehydrogenase (short-subunit alcohol dehydrogenase family)
MGRGFDEQAAAGRRPLLEEKVILITGAASGIGRKTAELCVLAGAHVAACDRQPIATELLATQDQGDRVQTAVVDVTVTREVDEFVGAVVNRHGHLDGVITAAGVGTIADRPLAVQETSDEVWGGTIGINLTGTFITARAGFSQMLDDGGVIVTIASVMGLVGQPHAAPYDSSKGGVISLTRALAIDGAEYGIRANTICPGFIDTPMVRTYLDKLEEPETAYRQIVDAHLINRLGAPEEIAAAAVWLCSDAASFITGAVLPVDGGYTAR